MATSVTDLPGSPESGTEWPERVHVLGPRFAERAATLLDDSSERPNISRPPVR
jgi:hypothetical protein